MPRTSCFSDIGVGLQAGRSTGRSRLSAIARAIGWLYKQAVNSARTANV